MQNSDSLITAFISLDHYMPFYWGENRLGTLIPLLARPIADVRLNVLFQSWIACASAIGIVILVQRYLCDPDAPWARNLGAACFAVALCLLLVRESVRVGLLLLAQPYFPSLLMMITATVLLLRLPGEPRWRQWLLAAVCYVLSFWLNVSNLPAAAGLIALLPHPRKLWRATLRARAAGLLLLACCFLAVRLFSSLYPGNDLPFFADLSTWQGTLQGMWSSVWSTTLYPARMTAVGAAAVLAWFFRGRSGRPDARTQQLTHAAWLLTGAAFALIIPASEWVRLNGPDSRYWTVPAAMITVQAVCLVAAELYRLISARITPSRVSTLAAFTLVGGSIATFGLPSVQSAFDRIDAATGIYRQEIRTLGCQYMIGDYFVAWPPVFYSRAHDDRPALQAITNRTGFQQAEWSKTDPAGRSYCAVCGDPDVPRLRELFKMPEMRLVSRIGRMCMHMSGGDLKTQPAMP